MLATTGPHPQHTARYQEWLAAEEKRGNAYPEISTAISESHMQTMWHSIDSGHDPQADIALNKLLNHLTAQPARRAALVMSHRTQCANTKRPQIMTPLMAAVASGIGATVRTLLENGGSGVRLGINIGTSSAGRDAMTVATEYGHADIMSLLVNLGGFGNLTALRVVERGETRQRASVAWLCSQGIESAMLGGALQAAVRRRDDRMLKLLVKTGGARLSEHISLLPEAICEGEFKLARTLVELGAPVNLRSFPLAVEKSVGSKKDEKVDSDLFTPLDLAVYRGGRATAQSALGIRCPKDDVYGNAARDELKGAAANERRALVSLLVSHGAPVNDSMLLALAAQQDFATYADLVAHEEFWPTDLRVVARIREQVSLTKNPMAHVMLQAQAEVMDLPDPAKIHRSKQPTGDDAARRSSLARANFYDAVALVQAGEFDVKLVEGQTLAVAARASIDRAEPSNAIVAFVRGGKAKAPAVAKGRTLAADVKGGKEGKGRGTSSSSGFFAFATGKKK